MNDNEKGIVEEALINKLMSEREKEIDTLIVETLAYLKSENALPYLKNLMENCFNEMTKLKIATSIFEINEENDMVDVAISSLKKIDDNKDPYYVYKLTSTFYYLIKFKNPRINKILKSMLNTRNILLPIMPGEP